MNAGEVWLANFDQPRPVVLLHSVGGTSLRGIQIVAPAATDITGTAIEVSVPALEGFAFSGVVRMALPIDGAIPCTWMFDISSESDLAEKIGTVPAATLAEIELMVELCDPAWRTFSRAIQAPPTAHDSARRSRS
ncbi:hypothetical protein ACPPVQ_15925 [Diaminobutyricibacter sp. McL0618]|uniref:hypothetical protein n=1 Tax=Leifsonia sp. McL0618 TaxID=3415677 RepID=UPI003CF7920B